ncbi:unnamed protein product [Ostreobium quekettii]|uniref:RNA helicase n=1 Tax=Ostreobium quekettii TaxID=121088 RepID=A0A8S1J2E6_9CHLO|nr:unnamed protein product [Ostreobium quekettii]
MAFLKPGALSPAAFGLSFDTDAEENAPPPPHYNKNDRLSIRDQRRALPISALRSELLYSIESHGVTVVVGETGCGKSTQIPQYLVEAGWAEGGRMVGCTQPRRVAAMAVAGRVAEEMGCRLGDEVGYSIRFEDVSTPGVTRIKFMTDGMLLRQMLDDPLLTKYSVIIVDEAHERSLASDVLLGLLKKIQARRQDLRLVIASATLEAERLAQYFDTRTVRVPGQEIWDYKAPVIISVTGRSYPVQVFYNEHPAANYVEAAVETAVEIHKRNEPGDILIFMTGEDECEAAVKLLREEARHLAQARLSLKLQPVALYSGLPGYYQMQALQPPQRGHRKVVVATNIAETSVTIEGVVYVIDSCYMKTRCYNPINGLDSLIVTPISKASAAQRAGRAGRVRPGYCFRLCMEDDFDTLMAASVPEIQRSDLAGVVLQLKALGIENIMRFKFLDAPAAEAVIRSLELLHALGALDEDARLTRPTGLMMSELPLEPTLSKALLAAAEFGCTEEATTIASILSIRSVWTTMRGEIKALERAKKRFSVAEGDLNTYLNVHRAWEQEGRSRQWCEKNFVSHRALLRASDIRGSVAANAMICGVSCPAGVAIVVGDIFVFRRHVCMNASAVRVELCCQRQLVSHLRRIGVPMTSRGKDMEPVQRAFAWGWCMNAVQYQGMDVSAMGHETRVYRLTRAASGGE